MIDRQRVISAFEQLYDAGDYAERLTPFCEAACLAVEAKMRKNADCSDSRIISLAAALLNRRIISRIADDDGVASFRAGDVTVTKKTGEKIKEAGEDVSRALELAAPLLRDDSFLFIRC